VNFNGIDYGLAQTAGGMDGADVYLDGLPNLRTKTDASGRFELTGVPVGEHFVVAEKTVNAKVLKVRDRVEIATPEQTADLRSMVLRQTGSVTGLIALEGRLEGLLGADVFVAGTTMVAKAKDNGAFAFANMAEGAYNVTAAFPGYSPVTKTVTVKAGRTAQTEFDLKPASPAERPTRLTARILGADGQPLPGSAVSLRGPVSLSALADDAGRVELVKVPAGDYALVIYHPGHTVRTVNRQVPPPASDAGGEATLDLGELRLTRAGGDPGPGTSPVASQGGAKQVPAAGNTTVLGPSQNANAGGPVVPGKVADEIAFPGGDPRTTPFGLQLLGDKAYNVKCAQAFRLKEAKAVTALAFSVSQYDAAPPADCTVSLHRANAAGDPEGAPLRAVILPAAQIRKFGLGNLFTPVVFDPPVDIVAAQAYVATIESKGMAALLLSKTPGSFGSLRMLFAEPDQEGWLWNDFPHDQTPETTGYKYAVLRVYTREP
jgi:hypothetical protein